MTKLSGQEIYIYSIFERAPIEYVTVYAGEKDFSVISDAYGAVTITGLSSTDQLTFQHPSYHTETFTLGEIEDAGNNVYLIDKVIMIDEIVLSADKSPVRASRLSNKVDVISMKEIAFNNPQTSADMLEQSGDVFVQKSQMGGGSPVIRGFEANRVLIVVDGVRMNNAIYRSGHLQNVISIDNNILDRTEVVYGPGSLIYGSDALGGVMHFYTRNPKLSSGKGVKTELNYVGRFSSANMEKTGHLDLGFGSSTFGSLSSITFSDFDDLRSGRSRNPFYGNWGLTSNYIASIGGMDTIVPNEQPENQLFSGYRQVDLLQKFLFKPEKHLKFNLNFQYSTTSDIPRFDRLREQVIATDTIEMGFPQPPQIITDTILRFANWSYGPQRRAFFSFDLESSKEHVAYDHLRLVTAFQDIREERISREYRSVMERRRLEEVRVVTTNLDLRKTINGKNSLLYGIEYTYNNVQSSAKSINIATGESGSASTRYPEGGSDVHTAAVYVKHKLALSDKFIISEGLRFSFVHLISRFDNTSFFDFEFDKIRLRTSAITGSIDFVYNPDNSWRFNTLLSTGFRAPNVDDIGKVFDPATGIVVVPNSELKPEYAYNFEVGLSKKFKDAVSVGGVGFFTLIDDVITLRPHDFNGSDSLLFEGVPSRVYANVNSDRGYITGFSVSLKADVTTRFSIESNISFTRGVDLELDTPLTHIPPVYGRTNFIYHHGKFKGEFFVRYNGWKDEEDYGIGSSDNLDEATEFGTPAWFTLNLRTGYQFNKYIGLQFGIDNILDDYYRPFSSGIGAPGRNFIVALRGNI